MNLEDLVMQIQSVGLYAIQVESVPERHESLSVVGSLEQYLQAVKAIGSNVAFISTITLVEEHFQLEPEEHEDDEESDEKPIDLCAVVPQLSGLKKKIGIIGHFDLAAPMSANNLSYVIVEDWWREFVDLRHQAVQVIKERREAALKELDAENEEQELLALKKLHALINDKNFVRLPTQRAMREYALEKVPELEVIDESELKRELQDLNARIHARGIDRK